MDVSHTIEAKSDQLNADDLVAGPIVVKIMGVSKGPADQPVVVKIAGETRSFKPWKPCKTMRRVLVGLWGADASKWVGEFVRLYRDPKVKWAGVEVGGIRMDQASIKAPFEIALALNSKKKEMFKIMPLGK